MADEPIKIGSGASSLIAEVGSHIIGDDYGVQHGTVRYFMGEQSSVQSSRIALGAAYGGSLGQFSGFVVEKSGDITGGDATTARLDVAYARIDPLWVVPPVVGVESEFLQLNFGTAPTGAEFLSSLYTFPVIVPHPTMDYSFAQSSRTNAVGTYGFPSGVPDVQPFTFRISQSAITQAYIQIIAPYAGTILDISPNGICSFGLFAGPQRYYLQISATPEGASPLHITFNPETNGWLCVQDNSTAICGGAIYLIRQKWIRRYVFAGMSGGTLWTGTCLV